jgi:signal transduction histidine kinase
VKTTAPQRSDIATSGPTANAAARRIAALEEDVRRLTEAAQRESRAKDEFLATLSHELRTPLNAVLGWLQLLRLNIDKPPERTHAMDVLERNVLAQVQLVADLLDLSRIVTGRMRIAHRRVQLDKVVRRGMQPLLAAAGAKNVDLQVEIEPIRLAVFGDAPRLQQVVWNLVSNAVRCTSSGGHIVVRVHPEGGHEVEIQVADTGCGIGAEVLPFVFDRFRQGDSSPSRPYGGLGLGLALVRHLIELHGGSVRADSAGIGRGATFTVRLPAREARNRMRSSANAT